MDRSVEKTQRGQVDFVIQDIDTFALCPVKVRQLLIATTLYPVLPSGSGDVTQFTLILSIFSPLCVR